MLRYFTFIIIIMLSCTKEPEPESICYNEDYPPENIEKVTINQGLWGDVWLWKGDFKPVNFGTICQVQRTIYIYELTELNDVVRAEPYTPFYSTINTKLVATCLPRTNLFIRTNSAPLPGLGQDSGFNVALEQFLLLIY